MHDAVAVELVHEDMDQVMAENFTDQEQFVLWVRDQDYDLDTCLELCDVVHFLNEDTSERETEESCSLTEAEYDFAKLRDLEDRQEFKLAWENNV